MQKNNFNYIFNYHNIFDGLIAAKQKFEIISPHHRIQRGVINVLGQLRKVLQVTELKKVDRSITK